MTRKVMKKMDHVYAAPSDGALMVLEDEEREGEKGDEVNEVMKTRLKKAFHSLARKYHPDTSTDEASAARFMAISKAYTELVKDSPEGKKSRQDKEDEEKDENSPTNVFDGISEEEIGSQKISPIIFAEDGLESRAPSWIPPPDILLFTVQDCLNGDIRRFIRFNLQIKEFVCILETNIEYMKKPLYHFGRLGYVLDLVQPFDTHPHNKELLLMCKFRYIDIRKKD